MTKTIALIILAAMFATPRDTVDRTETGRHAEHVSTTPTAWKMTPANLKTNSAFTLSVSGMDGTSPWIILVRWPGAHADVVLGSVYGSGSGSVSGTTSPTHGLAVFKVLDILSGCTAIHVWNLR